MIFGIGAAVVFYVTTGQCFNDIKSTIYSIFSSRRNSNYEELPTDLLLEEGGATSESSAIAKERKPSYGS